MLSPSPMLPAKMVVTTSETVSAKLPKPVLDVYRKATKVTTAVRTLHPGDVLATLVADALAADRDPATDAAVQRAFLAQQLGNEGMTKNVNAVVGEEMRHTFSQHADAIVAALSKPFAIAAATLEVAHERIGDVSLEETDRIMRTGGDIAAVWATASDALRVTDQIHSAWVALAQLTGFAPVDPTRVALRLAAPADVQHWETFASRSAGTRTKPNAWDCLLAGFTLGLADRNEYRRRLATTTPTSDQQPTRREVYDPVHNQVYTVPVGT